jgi:hypothetical protein
MKLLNKTGIVLAFLILISLRVGYIEIELNNSHLIYLFR